MDFLAALVAWFDADPALVAAFPGGLVLSRQPPGASFPMAQVAHRRLEPGLSAEDDQYAVTFRVDAAGDDACAELAELLAERLEDETREPMAFLRRGNPWVEAAVLPGDVVGPDLVVTRSPDPNTGKDVVVYRATMPYEIRAVRADL